MSKQSSDPPPLQPEAILSGVSDCTQSPTRPVKPRPAHCETASPSIPTPPPAATPSWGPTPAQLAETPVRAVHDAWICQDAAQAAAANVLLPWAVRTLPQPRVARVPRPVAPPPARTLCLQLTNAQVTRLQQCLQEMKTSRVDNFILRVRIQRSGLWGEVVFTVP
ncbi:hypothetical protein CALVIDRAFT_596852 [Calocera viscosa TUFC12733]|uniref:Uncharacterized protein n=1 Tax=Calocera viscosa (strain TUFC12733) TaxID=1330018 RepID=A0A167P176_CALVF|nr:hypothetical protein CALVIDRAFT_596852 [Calocera viscosa TUFC12733]